MTTANLFNKSGFILFYGILYVFQLENKGDKGECILRVCITQTGGGFCTYQIK